MSPFLDRWLGRPVARNDVYLPVPGSWAWAAALQIVPVLTGLNWIMYYEPFEDPFIDAWGEIGASVLMLWLVQSVTFPMFMYALAHSQAEGQRVKPLSKDSLRTILLAWLTAPLWVSLLVELMCRYWMAAGVGELCGALMIPVGIWPLVAVVVVLTRPATR